MPFWGVRGGGGDEVLVGGGEGGRGKDQVGVKGCMGIFLVLLCLSWVVEGMALGRFGSVGLGCLGSSRVFSRVVLRSWMALLFFFLGFFGLDGVARVRAGVLWVGVLHPVVLSLSSVEDQPDWS